MNKTPDSKKDAVGVSMVRLVRQAKYYPRPQTFKEWCHMSSCGATSPDSRSEFRKIRELIREGSLPNA